MIGTRIEHFQPQASYILLNSTTLKQILQVNIDATSCFLAFSASNFLNVVELSFSPLDSSETRSTTSICNRPMILRPIFLDKVFQAIKKKHFQKFLHGSTLKRETQTFSCDKPLSALFLLTDSPPGNVSLLPETKSS